MSGNSEISGNSEKLTGGSGIKEDQSEVKNLSQTRGNTYSVGLPYVRMGIYIVFENFNNFDFGTTIYIVFYKVF